MHFECMEQQRQRQCSSGVPCHLVHNNCFAGRLSMLVLADAFFFFSSRIEHTKAVMRMDGIAQPMRKIRIALHPETNTTETWHLDSNRYCLLFIFVAFSVSAVSLLHTRSGQAISVLQVTSHRILKKNMKREPMKIYMTDWHHRWRHVSGRNILFSHCHRIDRVKRKDRRMDEKEEAEPWKW